MRILTRYILSETGRQFGVGLAAFTLILVAERLFELFHLLVNKGVRLEEVARMFFYLLPGFLMLSVPMAALFACLLTFSRLSDEQEITALRSSGISVGQMVLPLAGLLFLFGCGMALFNSEVVPRSRRAFQFLWQNVLYRSPVLKLEPEVLTEVGAYAMYAENVDPKTGGLTHVRLIRYGPDQGPLILTGRTGEVPEADERGVHLNLREGELLLETTATKRVVLGAFERNEVALRRDPEEEEEGRREVLTQEEIPTLELLARPQKSRFVRAEIQSRLALAFSLPCLGLLGGVLGIRIRASGRMSGAALSLVALFGYYLAYTTGMALSGRRGLWPEAGPWLGNLACLAAIAVMSFLRGR